MKTTVSPALDFPGITMAEKNWQDLISKPEFLHMFFYNSDTLTLQEISLYFNWVMLYANFKLFTNPKWF